MKKVILVDGNNLLFRSYYATAYTGNLMKNSKGFPTNAIYGFINMINKIINEEKPEYIMIAFDKGKTFRHEKYADYKGGRSETPDELKMQFPIAKEICEAMGIHYFEIDNYEADDIIGTFAKKIDEDKEYDATIISSDKDLLQLISPAVDMKLLKQTGFIRMDEEEFKKTYGVMPIGMIDLKALMGDSSDNIPGVKGIGEKTAISLLTKYQTLDNLYAHLDEQTPKLREKLETEKENAYKSYDLATIYKEVPIDTDLEKIAYHGVNALEYIKLLEELEFYSLIKKLNIDKEMIAKDENIEGKEVEVSVNILDNLDNFKINGNFALYIETFGDNYHKDEVLGVSIYNKDISFYIPFNLLLENKDIFKTEYEMYTYDLKKLSYIFKKYDITLPKCNYDCMIAGYLLNYNIKDDISYLARNKKYAIDFVIVNAENSADGMNNKKKIFNDLLNLKVDAITMGNHTWGKKDIFKFIDNPHLLVPANYTRNLPGNRYGIYECKGKNIAVINLIGRVDVNVLSENPFMVIDDILEKTRKEVDIIIVDFHAEATAEKVAMGYYLDGRVNIIFGTHTHVQTADEKILEKGTGYITDIGMTGAKKSVIGMDVDASIKRFVTTLPERYKSADGDSFLNGCIFEINEDNCRITKINRLYL